MAAWNSTFEATPAGTDAISDGDNQIRNTRLEVRTRGQREHAWGNGGPDDGYHLEGAARAFYTDTDPAVLNSAATPSGGGGAALSSANSRGRYASYTVDGNYWYRVYDGSAWREVKVMPTVSAVNSTYAGTFDGTVHYLQNSAGLADLVATITTPAKGAWYIEINYTGTIKNTSGGGGGDKTGVVQLVFDTGGAATVMSQTHATLGNNQASALKMYGLLTIVPASTIINFRVRGFCSAGGTFRWNETTTNPLTIEFVTPFSSIIATLHKA
jgi:hypothetical protein